MARTPRITRPALRRLRAGEYVLADASGRMWSISRLDFGYGPEWLAACLDVPRLALDPLPTLGRAAAAVRACQE